MLFSFFIFLLIFHFILTRQVTEDCKKHNKPIIVTKCLTKKSELAKPGTVSEFQGGAQNIYGVQLSWPGHSLFTVL